MTDQAMPNGQGKTGCCTGQNLGVNMQGIGESSPSMMLAVIVGGVAALAGAIVWALVAYYANLEIGYLAWGIGALVGLAFLKFYKPGGTVAGILAVALALGGITVGKFLTMDMYFSSDKALQEVLKSPEETGLLALGAYLQMKEMPEYPKADEETLDGIFFRDQELPQSPTASVQGFLMSFSVYYQSLTDVQKKDAARKFLDHHAKTISLQERAKASFKLFDIIFILLAVGTSFKLASARD